MQSYAFTADFATAAVARFLADPVLLSRAASLVRPERFAAEEARLLVEHAVAFFKSHRAVPTPVEALQSIRAVVEAGKLPADIITRCAQYIEAGLNLPPVDGGFVYEQIARAERKQAIWEALESGLKSYPSGRFDEIAADVAQAAQIGKADTQPGVEFGPDLNARTERRKSGKEEQRWGTGIGDLDDILRGGLAAGELGCVLGAPKHGKSHLLGQVSHHAMELGGSALYVSLEMSEASMLDRFDAAIAKVPLSQLRDRADYVRDKVQAFLEATGGSVIVKQFPPGSTTVAHIEAYMRVLRAERSYVPSVVVVDYGDLVAAERAGEKRYQELGTVYTDLRRLAVDWKVPVWTASQATREALSKKVVTMADIAESFKKVAISDVVVAICGTEDERASGVVRFNVAACRYATSSAACGPYRTAFHMGRMVEGAQLQEVAA